MNIMHLMAYFLICILLLATIPATLLIRHHHTHHTNTILSSQEKKVVVVTRSSEAPKKSHAWVPQPQPQPQPSDVRRCGGHETQRGNSTAATCPAGSVSSFDVQLYFQDDKVVLDNGLVQVTLSNPAGWITGIQFNGIDNLLEIHNEEYLRGYWDLVWGTRENGHHAEYDRIKGTNFTVIKEDPNQVELSFTRNWNPLLGNTSVPLKIDLRFVMLSGSSGFYSYAIYEHLDGWPDFDLAETRIVLKPSNDKFHYMAITDERQRIMPTPEDRSRGQTLAYPEAVLLTNTTNPDLKGEVDDKYQYSCETKDYGLHGWIDCYDSPTGLWMITPSNEFRNGGPIKQDLTAHVGPTLLSMFVSLHYGGENVLLRFRDGEPWKKVFGPVFIYLNSVCEDGDPHTALWEDAKEQMVTEVENWPYTFPVSEDFPSRNQRGTVSGRLVIQDRYISEDCIAGNSAYVGLAPLGNVGSWQTEGKGYQFWSKADADGVFSVNNIREGDYNLYAYVLGFIGDYKYDVNLTITAGCDVILGDLIFVPPRDGPTLWEIGIPDRSAAEFYIPDPDPIYINKLYLSHPNSAGEPSTPVERFRQYGLWERYAELYPDGDLIYIAGVYDYQNDWFYAHVPRKTRNNTYQATTWQVLFELNNVDTNTTYKLRLALASATAANLHVRVNNPELYPPHFETGVIGTDNAIARHGIYGLYRLLSVNIPSDLLVGGGINTIYLTQTRNLTRFEGIMYDYIRLEGPCNS